MDVGGEESWEGREQAEQGVDGNGGGWEGRSGACDMAETSHVKCHALLHTTPNLAITIIGQPGGVI